MSNTWRRSGSGRRFLLKIIRAIVPSSKGDFKKKINDVIYRLNIQKDKLEEVLTRLHQRDKELFEKTISAYIAKDMARATIYASEVAEIRKIAKIIYSSKLALEKIIIRLETIREISNIAIVLAPIISILKDLKSQLVNIIPETAIELEEITNMMNSMLIEFGEVSNTTVTISVNSEEARKILEEAKAVAEEKIKEKFPELPPALMETEKTRVQTPLAIALPTSGGTTTITSPVKKVRKPPRHIPLEELELRVLDYLKEHNGLIDVSKCAQELDVSRDDILKALESLNKKGKIRFT
ncbi:MAG TPA: hypothetical protein EYH40_00600 [Desulfurococcales archaeon]|nr:hypothetical protein [Desulfurococcales archaeon]